MRTIAHLSDLHFGRHDPRVTDALAASLTERAPDLVAISGDFTQRARSAEFAEARAFLDSIPQPKLLVPGNHDVPLYDVVSRVLKPFDKFERFLCPAGLAQSLFLDDDLAVLGLNTARRFTGKNGRISFAQMARMRQVFCPLCAQIMKVLVTHHPLAATETQHSLQLAGRSSTALRVVAETGVHVLLSGHHHRFASGAVAPRGVVTPDVTVEGHVLVVHAGTAISTRLRGAEGNNYNWLAIERDRVSVTVMHWASPQGFRAGATASYVLENGRWRAA
jgi:3',5'-cyclic AMP phosphodiesterase CpdA